MQFQNLKSYERRTLFSPLKHVKFKLSVNLKLFFFKNASCAFSFDTIIAVFTGSLESLDLLLTLCLHNKSKLITPTDYKRESVIHVAKINNFWRFPKMFSEAIANYNPSNSMQFLSKGTFQISFHSTYL